MKEGECVRDSANGHACKCMPVRKRREGGREGGRERGGGEGGREGERERGGGRSEGGRD